jgi:hypothetical protein
MEHVPFGTSGSGQIAVSLAEPPEKDPVNAMNGRVCEFLLPPKLLRMKSETKVLA